MLLIVCGAPAAFAADDQTICAERDGARSIDACTRLLSSAGLGPVDRARTYALRGTMYRSGGDYPHAIADFTQLVELLAKEPSKDVTASALVVRGTTYSLAGDHAQALADFRRALALSPADEQARDGIKQAEAALASLQTPKAEPPALAAPAPAVHPAPLKAKPPDKPAGEQPRAAPARTAVAHPQPAQPAQHANRIALNPGILKKDPPPHSMTQNQVVLVDDGSCPKGMIKRIVAGGRRHAESRRSYCAPPP